LVSGAAAGGGRVGLKLSRGAPIDSFRQVWRIADDAGFDHCWAFDHLATSSAADDPVLFDGWTLLAAMAEVTASVRIGLIVTGMIYRHPAVLAKQAATVDHLSAGRLEFGIGAGSAELEQQMFGIGPGDHLVGRFSEGLHVIRTLWTQGRSDFAGKYFNLDGAIANPKPVQQPHPPIWIGASGPLMLGVTARYADVWNWAGEGLEAAVAAAEQLTAACRQVDRDPAEIRWSVQFAFDGTDPEGKLAEIRPWYEAGFRELVFSCSGREPVRAAEVAAERILPALRQFD
jgi:alkanesulfonate monooxygenase SsuD/methylene tetrahydromethanopterin reductase-like flavin-dependent oxidoreductase (luciferase family)